jgi:hypothetical protein
MKERPICLSKVAQLKNMVVEENMKRANYKMKKFKSKAKGEYAFKSYSSIYRQIQHPLLRNDYLFDNNLANYPLTKERLILKEREKGNKLIGLRGLVVTDIQRDEENIYQKIKEKFNNSKLPKVKTLQKSMDVPKFRLALHQSVHVDYRSDNCPAILSSKLKILEDKFNIISENNNSYKFYFNSSNVKSY